MLETLTIEKLIFGGEGLAHKDGRTYFIADVLPGETVEAEVYGTKAHCLLGQAASIVDPSPDRVEPFCRYAYDCGGCQWQFMKHEAQIAAKKAIFADCLRRLGKIHQTPDIEVFSGPDRGYRQRVQFKIDQAAKTVGFFVEDSREVVDIEECPLLVPSLNTFLAKLRAAIPSGVEQVKAIALADGSVASEPVLQGGSVKSGSVEVAGKRFKVNGDSFFQQNRPMLAAMAQWAGEDLSGKRCLDLYGGVGLFSVFHGRRFGSGVLVEAVESAAALARSNLAANGVSNFTAQAQTVEQFLATGTKREKPDCIIVDPPRSGMPRAVREGIGRLNPAMILYISCDAATQARDAGWLVNDEGYEIRRIALFDLYPQTHHLETGMLLVQG